MAIRRVNGTNGVNDKRSSKRRLFPVALFDYEKAWLSYLSTESGQPMGSIIRRLIREESLKAYEKPKSSGA